MYIATKADVRRWWADAKKEKATHILVVNDTFSYEDYPVMVKKGEDHQKIINEKYSGQNMQKTMFVYDMSKDIEGQMELHGIR